MADMHVSPFSLPLPSVAAEWRNRLTKKWLWPCGKVLPTVQTPESKVFGIHCSGAQHKDWVRYGKAVPDFFWGNVAFNTCVLGMLIRGDNHPELLGAVPLPPTWDAAAATAALTEFVPNHPVTHLDEGSIDSVLEMDLDAPIPLRKRKCPGVLPRQAATLQQLRRMYPVMRANYEKPPWEFCDRRWLLALDCRTDGHWGDLARRYGPCPRCHDLLSGKHAAGLNSLMNTAINPKDTAPHYRQGPHVLSRCLHDVNDRGYVAEKTLGQLREDLHKFRQRCETYKALIVATTVPLLGVGQHAF